MNQTGTYFDLNKKENTIFVFVVLICNGSLEVLLIYGLSCFCFSWTQKKLLSYSHVDRILVLHVLLIFGYIYCSFQCPTCSVYWMKRLSANLWTVVCVMLWMKKKKGINLDLICFNVVSLKISTMTNKNYWKINKSTFSYG